MLTVCFYFLFAAKFFCGDALCDPITIEKVRVGVKSITIRAIKVSRKSLKKCRMGVSFYFFSFDRIISREWGR